MASSLGVSITIGAVLAGSVAAAFGSVSKRLGSLDAKIAATARKSSVLGRALELAALNENTEEMVGILRGMNNKMLLVVSNMVNAEMARRWRLLQGVTPAPED